jgi:cytochrome c oxidase subunit 2
MKKSNIIWGVVIVVVILSFAFGSYDYGADGIDFEGEVLEINVEAFKFGYNPDVIRVKQGDNVRLLIDNSNGVHGMRIPMLLVDGIDTVEFVASKKGEFTWYCNNYCGSGHNDMSGTLIVE